MKTIIVNDDEPMIRGVLKLVFKKDGFHVIETNGFAEFKKVWDIENRENEVEVEVVLTDLQNSGGDEIVRFVRGMCPKMPVFLMTGEPQVIPADISGLLDGVFVKPFFALEVCEEIDRFLRMRKIAA